MIRFHGAGITIPLLLGINAAAAAQRVFATVEPRLRVGQADGTGPSVFGRVGDVKVDSKGRIVVLDQLASEVRVFDNRGQFVLRFGRAGKGPGELSRGVTDVLIGARDTILVPDAGQGRISVFTSNGKLVRTITFRPQPLGQSWNVAPDGSYFFRGITIERTLSGFQVGDAIYQRSASGEELTTIATLDYPKSDIGGPGKPLVPAIVNAAFWTRLVDGAFAWSSLDRSWVLLLDRNGRMTDTLKHSDWKNVPIQTRDRVKLRQLLKTKLELLGGDVSVVDRPIVQFPERLPAITGVRAGKDGTPWVQAMGRVEDAEPMAINATDRTDWLGGRTWYVFARDRAFLGVVNMPPRTRITELGADYIVAIQRDDQDAESVVWFDLKRR